MGNILFVDDEVRILNAIKRGMRKSDHECHYVTSGQAALRVIEETPIDVVVTDMKMPEMNGLELLRNIDKVNDEVVKIILSGYAQLQQLIATINQTSIFRYVSKPFDLYGDLIPAIDDAAEYAEYRKEMHFKRNVLESKNEVYQKMLKNMSSKSKNTEFSYDLVRIFQQVVMNTIKLQVEDESLDSEQQKLYLNNYKKFCDNYLQGLKKNDVYFQSRRIFSEVKYHFKSKEYKLKIESGVADNNTELYEGRGAHIKPIIIGLIENYIQPNEIGTVYLVSTESHREDNKIYLNYVIESSARLYKDLNENNYDYKLFKTFLNTLGGDLSIVYKKDKVDIVMKVVLFVLSEDIEEDVKAIE